MNSEQNQKIDIKRYNSPSFNKWVFLIDDEQRFDIVYHILENGEYWILSLGNSKGNKTEVLQMGLEIFSKESYLNKLCEFTKIGTGNQELSEVELEILNLINENILHSERDHFRYRDLMIMSQGDGIISWIDDQNNNHTLYDEEGQFVSEMSGLLNAIANGIKTPYDEIVKTPK